MRQKLTIPRSTWQRPFAYPWRCPAWAAMVAVSGLVAGLLFLETASPGFGSGDRDSSASTSGYGDSAGADGIARARTGNSRPDVPDRLVISGAVIVDRGGPLPPGVLVAAELAGTPGHAPSSTGPGRDVRRTPTDSHGRFTFRDVVAGGEYLLSVEDGEDFHGTSQMVRAGMVSAELRLQAVRSLAVDANVLDQDDGEPKGTGVRVPSGFGVLLSDGSGAHEITIEPIRVRRPSALEFQHLHYRSQRARVPAPKASKWVTELPEGAFLGVDNNSGRGGQAAVRDAAMAMEME